MDKEDVIHTYTDTHNLMLFSCKKERNLIFVNLKNRQVKQNKTHAYRKQIFGSQRRMKLEG